VPDEVDPEADGQCVPLQGGVWIGPGSAIHAVDTTGLVGFDIVQPVTGQLTFQISGTDAEIIDSEVNIMFTTTIPDLGDVITDTTSTIEGAVGTISGDQIEWTTTQELIGNGTVICNLGALICGIAGFADGLNELVDGCNITLLEGPPPCPTTIMLPVFRFSVDGQDLLNTGEFEIDPDQFVALEGSFIPEPASMLMLGPGLLLVLALDRRRARSRR
jgi:hypothetical protein